MLLPLARQCEPEAPILQPLHIDGDGPRESYKTGSRLHSGGLPGRWKQFGGIEAFQKSGQTKKEALVVDSPMPTPVANELDDPTMVARLYAPWHYQVGLCTHRSLEKTTTLLGKSSCELMIYKRGGGMCGALRKKVRLLNKQIQIFS